MQPKSGLGCQQESYLPSFGFQQNGSLQRHNGPCLQLAVQEQGMPVVKAMPGKLVAVDRGVSVCFGPIGAALFMPL